MPTVVSAFGATVSSGRLRDARVNDDRCHVDVARGLFIACDASGPVYGGYYAPFAIDPGLEAFLSTFALSYATTRERMSASLHAAHATMRSMHRAYEEERGGRLGLDVARAAADAVRPARWHGYDSLAHFAGSITVCAVGADAVVIGQVGGSRAYALRSGALELLAPDHSIGSGDHASVLLALLGGQDEAKMNVVEVAAPERVVICTDGVWRVEAELRALFEGTSEADVQRAVERCARASRDDATAVVVTIRPQ